MEFNFCEGQRKFDKREINNKIIGNIRMQEKYRNAPVVNIMNELSHKAIEIIEKLGIKLESKIYTEYEFDILEGNISDYYIYEGMAKEELSCVRSLDGTGVTNIDVEKVLKEMNEISDRHNF